MNFSTKFFGLRFGKPDTTEQGSVRGSRYLSDMAKWPAVDDDLLSKRSDALARYRVMRHDPEIKAALTILVGGLLARGWEVRPGIGEDEAGIKVAQMQCDDVQRAFDEMPGSVDDVLDSLTRDMLTLGTTIGERVYQIGTDGLVGYAALKPKDPTMFFFSLDEFNNVTGLHVLVDGTKREVDPAKFWLLANNAEYGQPWGTSELRAAHRWYWLKEKLTQWWAIYQEKFGSPTAKGTYPVGTGKAIQDELLRVLQSIQNETAIVVPENTRVELLEAARGNSSGVQGFQQMIQYCDQQMVKAMLGNTLTTSEGNRVGSMALGKVHLDTQELIITRLRRKIEEFVDEQWIRPLCDYNYAKPIYPNFSLLLDDKDIGSLAEALFRLISCGEVQAGESWIRDYLGLPAREEIRPDVSSTTASQGDGQDSQAEPGVPGGSVRA